MDLLYNMLYSKSTTNPQLFDKSTIFWQIHNFLYHKSTANPQKIEQVEFELKRSIHILQTHSFPSIFDSYVIVRVRDNSTR